MVLIVKLLLALLLVLGMSACQAHKDSASHTRTHWESSSLPQTHRGSASHSRTQRLPQHVNGFYYKSQISNVSEVLR
jgi:hypothetical protein